MPTQAWTEVREFISHQVTEGFGTVHEIIEQATHYAFERHGLVNVETDIKQITAQALTEHRRSQADWAGKTDCDRLDRAFEVLNGKCIVARQNFACCLTCGHREIWDEIEEVEKSHPVDGYVFYHLQCTEDAMKSGTLYMAYGSIEEDEECLQRVGHMVVQELCKAGLNASWNGNFNSPIVVTDLVWSRRR